MPADPKKSWTRRLLSFSAFIWLVGLFAALWLVAAPLAWNAWAAANWRQIDCHLASDNHGYTYAVDGTRYLATRRDFWQADYTIEPARENIGGGDETFMPNAHCWVNPRNPEDAVLYLDAPHNLGNGLGRFFEAGLVLVAVAAISLVAAKKSRKAPRPSQETPA